MILISDEREAKRSNPVTKSGTVVRGGGVQTEPDTKLFHHRSSFHIKARQDRGEGSKHMIIARHVIHEEEQTS
jgi:hypothetical protein